MTIDVHALSLVLGLFSLGLISPGPNFLVLTQTSLRSGFKAGAKTAAGIVLGDLLYASLGLLGLSSVILHSGWLFFAIKLLGGLYLAWLGLKMLRTQKESGTTQKQPYEKFAGNLFWRGLFTCLANPKSMVFFASIFAMGMNASTNMVTQFAMLTGICLISIGWRSFLAFAFSFPPFRYFYQNSAGLIEKLFGAFLILLGLKMTGETIYEK